MATLSEELHRHGRNDAIVVLVRELETLERKSWEILAQASTSDPPYSESTRRQLEVVHKCKLSLLLDVAAIAELSDLPELGQMFEAMAAVIREQGAW
jgi:hypothetical protein